MVYVVATLFSMLIAATAQLNVKKRSLCRKPDKVLFALSALPYILVLALRDGVGTDYYSIYVNGFNGIASGADSRFEPGYVLICKLCLLFSRDYHVMFAMVSILAIVLCYVAIFRISANPLMSVFLIAGTGYLMSSTNLIRQSLALSILLNAIPYLAGPSRNIWKYCAIVILASSFHSSALLLLVFYPLVKITLNIKKIIITMVVVIVLSGILVSLIGRLVSLFSAQLAIYFDTATEYSGAGNMDLSDLGYCLVLIVGFIYLSLLRRQISENEQTNAYGWLILVGIVCALISNVMFIFSRAAVYFTYCGILALPYFSSSIAISSKRDSRLLSIISLILMSGLTVYLYGFLRFSHALPYTSIFQ